jgi:aspartyl-tRNA(Asn)/glutamyl-tRNA(Gln) amidotransferase subunit A
MDARELPFLGVRALGELLSRGEVTSEEIVAASLGRIDRLNPALNVFITVARDEALRAARRADLELARGKCRSPLHGIPFAVKDALWTKGIRTTNGSRLFADFVPAEDATVVARLRAAGAILLGKLNMMEIGFGPTAHPPFGVPRNPWDLERTPGGSSSGSASAIAARLVPITLGADTGGSIRLPAALCGVVGLKPTRGRVSRYGLMGICPRLDCAGPLAATIADCALALQAIAGHDWRDPGTNRAPVPDYERAVGEGIQGLRVGVVKELMESDPLHPHVRGLLAEALAALEKSGARVEQVSIPLIEHSSAIYVGIAEPEAAALYRPYLLSRSSEIDILPRRRLLTASLIPASVTSRARELGEQLRAQVDEALRDLDVLAAPTTPTAAPPVPTATSLHSKDEAWLTAVAGRSLYTNPFNVTGHPALSTPCGFTSEGLPVALQLIGRHHREEDILRVAGAYQAVTAWHERRPRIPGDSDHA